MSKTNPQVNILGVDIDALTIDEAIARIIERSGQGSTAFVTKPYVEFFRRDHSDLLNRAWLKLPDGVALQWAAHFQETSGSLWQLIKTLVQIVFAPSRISDVLPDKFAGINFTWPLIEAAAANGRSLYLVGSPRGNHITQTAELLRHEIPGVDIVGVLEGRDESDSFSKQLEDKLVDQLRRLRPDIILVGLGFPRQEIVMDRIIEQLDHGVLIGEGGTFDYRLFGGKYPKAPKVMQYTGLEWFWRLMLQPKRIFRQLAIPLFIMRVYRRHRQQN